MPRLTASACCLILILLLILACTPTVPFGGDGKEFSYTEGAFSASVRGTLCRTAPDGYTGDPALVGEGRTNVPWTVAADIRVSAPDDTGSRTVMVTYTSPDSLQGLTITRTTSVQADGSVTVTDTLTMGSVTVTDADGTYTRLLLPALSLLPAGDVTDVARDEDGRRVLTAPMGKDTADGAVRCTFADGSRLPVSVLLTTSDYNAEWVVTEQPEG